MATKKNRSNERTLLLIAAVVAVIAVIGVVVVLVVGGGDDDDEGGADVDPFRPVSVSGDALPAFSREMQQGAIEDPAIGTQVPVVSGVDYAGNEITIDPANDGPTIVVLLAHWCPHCNSEIPVLNEWRDSGEVPDGLNVVGISTAVDASAPNFPPGEWLVDKDWQWPVLADDRRPDDETPPPAFAAYGGTSFPTLLFIDGDGKLALRISGEPGADVIDRLADQLVAAT